MLVKAIFKFLKKMSGQFVLMPLFVSLLACSPRSGVNVKILNPDLDKVRVSLSAQSHVVSGGPTRPVTISLNFNREVMIELASLNIHVVGGTLDLNSLSGSGSNYTFNVFPGADGSMGVSIPAQILSTKFGQTFQDKSSNAASTSFLVDSVSPLIMLSTNITSPTNLKSIPITISINKPISNLKVTDIVKTGASATISDFSGSNGNYQFILKPAANGDIVLKIPANKVQDTAGNWNPDSNDLVITYDNTVPLPKLSSTIPAITNTSSIPVVLEFKDEFNQAVNVTGLLEGEFVVTNGSISSFGGSGHEYSFNLIPASDGPVSVKLPAGLVQNPSGISNLESNTLNFTVDRVAPGLTVNPANISKGSVATTFTWVVDYVGVDQGIFLNPSYININKTGTVNCGSPVVTGTGNFQRQISVSGCSGDGNLQIIILAGSVVDLAGNAAGSVTSNQVGIDNTPPAINIGAPSPLLGNMNSTFSWTVSYTGAQASNLRFEDITILGAKTGCTKTVTPSGNTNEYFVKLTGCTGDGAVNFSIAGGTAFDDVGLAALGATSSSATVDNTIPFVAPASLTPATGNSATTFQLPVNFQGATSGPLSLSQVTVEGAGSAGCTRSVLGAYPNYTVEIKNCIGDGPMKVNIAAGVASDAAGNLSAAYSTSSVVVDNIAPTIVISSGTPLIGNSTKSFTWDVTYHDAPNIYLTKNSITFNSTINNCTIEDVLPLSASVYRVTIKSCSGDGMLGFQIFPGTGTDLAGNMTQAAVSDTVTVDNTAPTLTITNPIPTAGHAGTMFKWDLNYLTDTLPTLTDADITLGGFYIEGCAKTLTQNSSFHYTLSVTGCSALTGSLKFTVAEGSGHDAAGNPTPSVVSNSANISNVFPTVSVSAPSPSTGDKNTAFTFIVSYTDATNVTLNANGIEFFGSMGCMVDSVTGGGSLSRTVVVKGCTGSNKFAIKVKPGSATTSFGNTDSGSALSLEAILTNQLVVSFAESSSSVLKQGTTHAGSFNIILSDKAPSPVTIQYNVTSFTTATAADYNLSFATVEIPQGQSTGTIAYDYYGASSTGSRIIQLALAGGESATIKVAVGKNQVSRRIVLDPAQNPNFSKVVVGLSHSCGLTNLNKIMCWGGNSNYQLGDQTNVVKVQPTSVFGSQNYIDVRTNGNHTCGLRNDNQLECWGPNAEYQLGTIAIGHSAAPRVIDNSFSIKSFSVGDVHTCAISSTDQLFCWGSNSRGQLGRTLLINDANPELVDGGTLYSSVSAGVKHTCGITKSSGILKCWGDNSSGQLGNGIVDGAASVVPTAVSGGLGYKYVSAGNTHTCAIATTDKLYCWGANSSYQLGDGGTTQLLVPTLIDATNDYESVSAGRGNYTCGVLKVSGALKCWGNNAQGQLGDGTTTARPTGFVVDTGSVLAAEYASISAGNGHTCGVLKNGVTKCWGYNGLGGIGDGVTELQGSPIKIGDLNYNMLSAGESHTCGLDQSQKLKCWGQNKDGSLGDGTTNEKSSPVSIESGTIFKRISVGSRYSCGITQSDILRCWGVNTYGQLGDGTTVSRHVPVTIDGGSPYKEVSAGEYHTCGITTTGTLKCWGYNANGELGDASYSNRLAPVIIDSGSVYTSISAGSNHTCGISSGVLKCWGFNNKGQLGDSTNINKNSPVVLDLGTSYLNVSLGNSFTCGTTTNNRLKCWGLNTNGQLGNSSSFDSNYPVEIASNIATVSVGNAHACSLSTAGQLMCWGANSNSQLGNSQTTASNLGIEIDPGVYYSAIDLGTSHTCGITTLGKIKCWGSNKFGQIGIGNLMNLPSPVLVP